MNGAAEPEPLDDDLVDYIARRQGVDRAEASARLSEWLYLYFLSEASRRARARPREAPTCASSANPLAPR